MACVADHDYLLLICAERYFMHVDKDASTRRRLPGCAALSAAPVPLSASAPRFCYQVSPHVLYSRHRGQ